jgi:hypothetical protein
VPTARRHGGREAEERKGRADERKSGSGSSGGGKGVGGPLQALLALTHPRQPEIGGGDTAWIQLDAKTGRLVNEDGRAVEAFP